MSLPEEHEPKPWPCCLECTRFCCAGCGDRSTVLRTEGKVVGAFCRECFAELAHGQIPASGTRLPRRPRGLTLKDQQDAA